MSVLQPMTDADVPAVLEVPEPGALLGLSDGAVAGFAATRSDELLHFGVAVEQ